MNDIRLHIFLLDIRFLDTSNRFPLWGLGGWGFNPSQNPLTSLDTEGSPDGELIPFESFLEVS